MWSVILFSLLVGAGAAVFLHLFRLFWGDGNSYFLTWMLASGFVFLWVLPYWLRLRAASRGAFRNVPIPGGAPWVPEPPVW
jgi:hypothetical protein